MIMSILLFVCTEIVNEIFLMMLLISFKVGVNLVCKQCCQFHLSNLKKEGEITFIICTTAKLASMNSILFKANAIKRKFHISSKTFSFPLLYKYFQSSLNQTQCSFKIFPGDFQLKPSGFLIESFLQ